ncbi:MAG TPA: META domain-containing protein [Thermoleophilia bacterium]|nr:META domain-containing protein [Thermoleophilia bacterium]
MFRQHTRFVTIVFVSALLVALAPTTFAGCSSGAGDLDGTHWKLVEWTVNSLFPGDFAIRAQFADGQISGTSGVNSYSGPYKADGDSFEVSAVAGTLMAGPEPAMRAEAAYLTLLQQARLFAVSGSTLTLYDNGGNVSLVFEAVAD